MNKQFKHYLIRTLTGSTEGGSPEGSTTDPENNGNSTNPNTGNSGGSDTSKDFSRALARRVAEIEAKYADYDQLKEKAAKFDEAQNESKSELDKLAERLNAIEQERDELQAKQAHAELVNTVAQETGVPVELVVMLSGDEKSLKLNAEKLAESLKKQSSMLPPAGNSHRKNVEDEELSPRQRLANAYSASK